LSRHGGSEGGRDEATNRRPGTRRSYQWDAWCTGEREWRGIWLCWALARDSPQSEAGCEGRPSALVSGAVKRGIGASGHGRGPLCSSDARTLAVAMPPRGPWCCYPGISVSAWDVRTGPSQGNCVRWGAMWSSIAPPLGTSGGITCEVWARQVYMQDSVRSRGQVGMGGMPRSGARPIMGNPWYITG
jgi:hypothetical protein